MLFGTIDNWRWQKNNYLYVTDAHVYSWSHVERHRQMLHILQTCPRIIFYFGLINNINQSSCWINFSNPVEWTHVSRDTLVPSVFVLRFHNSQHWYSGILALGNSVPIKMTSGYWSFRIIGVWVNEVSLYTLYLPTTYQFYSLSGHSYFNKPKHPITKKRPVASKPLCSRKTGSGVAALLQSSKFRESDARLALCPCSQLDASRQ